MIRGKGGIHSRGGFLQPFPGSEATLVQKGQDGECVYRLLMNSVHGKVKDNRDAPPSTRTEVKANKSRWRHSFFH
ncbi:hypothetical protein AGOR_G00201320 [Albula goreensis]|uniref:Uncharacterized protein n=1 Tax=Albula goreensis TaxID=1534307 RepID=A0A8T3CX12_9TELE|nr:hypothetical protein AGOR_G00201320 [Albula goreensis]